MTKTSPQNSKRNFQLRQKYLHIFFSYTKRSSALHSLKSIADIDLPEVKDFLTDFLPAFTMTLDELNHPTKEDIP